MAHGASAAPRRGPGALRAHWAPLAVGGLTLLALLLRLPLAHDSLLGDELIMFQIVHDHSLSEVWHIVRETEKTPPLFFYLNWAAIRLGDPTEWIRAPAVLFGTALIPVVYGLGLRTVGRVAGVVAAAIVTLDPFAIFYGTEARPYGALACLGALSTLCLLEALDTNRRRWWAAYGLTVVGVAYTHYMGIFVLLVQVLWAFWVHRDRVAELVIVHALVVIAYVPWISSYVLQQQHSGDEATRVAALSPPSFARFTDIDVRLVLGHPFFPLSEIPGRVPVAIALAVIAVALAVAARRAWRARDRARLSSRPLLIGLLAVASPVGVGLVSLRPHMSFLLMRNYAASLPAAALIIAWLLTRLPRRAAAAAVAAILGVLVIGAAQASQPVHRRSDYRDAAAWVEEHARPGDPVVQSFLLQGDALGTAVTINFKHPHPTYGLNGVDQAPAWERGRQGAHVFVLLGLTGIFKDTQHLGRLAGPDNRFALIRERRYPGMETVIVGEYRYLGD
jgi:mannosyltransferase